MRFHIHHRDAIDTARGCSHFLFRVKQRLRSNSSNLHITSFTRDASTGDPRLGSRSRISLVTRNKSFTINPPAPIAIMFLIVLLLLFRGRRSNASDMGEEMEMGKIEQTSETGGTEETLETE